jgi:hypothetical protein
MTASSDLKAFVPVVTVKTGPVLSRAAESNAFHFASGMPYARLTSHKGLIFTDPASHQAYTLSWECYGCGAL